MNWKQHEPSCKLICVKVFFNAGMTNQVWVCFQALKNIIKRKTVQSSTLCSRVVQCTLYSTPQRSRVWHIPSGSFDQFIYHMICCFGPKQWIANWFYIFTIFRNEILYDCLKWRPHNTYKSCVLISRHLLRHGSKLASVHPYRPQLIFQNAKLHFF